MGKRPVYGAYYPGRTRGCVDAGGLGHDRRGAEEEAQTNAGKLRELLASARARFFSVRLVFVVCGTVGLGTVHELVVCFFLEVPTTSPRFLMSKSSRAKARTREKRTKERDDRKTTKFLRDFTEQAMLCVRGLICRLYA